MHLLPLYAAKSLSKCFFLGRGGITKSEISWDCDCWTHVQVCWKVMNFFEYLMTALGTTHTTSHKQWLHTKLWGNLLTLICLALGEGLDLQKCRWSFSHSHSAFFQNRQWTEADHVIPSFRYLSSQRTQNINWLFIFENPFPASKFRLRHNGSAQKNT